MRETGRTTSRQRYAVVSPPPQVRARWLLAALGLLMLAALCCAYLSLCLLFLQGQWQLLYHPSRTVATTPASVGLSFTPVQFGAGEDGIPRLTGWWVPAGDFSNTQAGSPTGSRSVGPPKEPDARPPVSARRTVLYLHDASGSLGDTVAALQRLHALGCPVLAMDYRGFGRSAGVRPSEATMVEDARSALTYLGDTLHIPGEAIVVWGNGIGATIAAESVVPSTSSTSSTTDRGEPRLVLEAPNAPAIALLQADPRTRFLPVRLLLRDRLDPSASLRSADQHKLFLESSTSGPTVANLFLSAMPPKQLASTSDQKAILAWLRAD